MSEVESQAKARPLAEGVEDRGKVEAVEKLETRIRRVVRNRPMVRMVRRGHVRDRLEAPMGD